MPRDDLTIDMMVNQTIETQDAAAVLEDFAYRAHNLPNEIQYMQDEIAHKDRQIQTYHNIILQKDGQLQKWVREKGSNIPHPKENELEEAVFAHYDKIDVLQAEKIALSAKVMEAIDKHTRYLDAQIKALQDKGEFPVDPDIPSLLRPQAATPAARGEGSGGPLSQLNNASSTLRAAQASAQNRMPNAPMGGVQQGTNATPAPTTPGAAAVLMQRQARESSTGPSNKKRVGSVVGSVPANSSSLARHSSLGPGTPKAGTPSGGHRAGSAQPRSSNKTIGNKKVAPHKQGGSAGGSLSRKNKLGKSGLSRVKRTGNKNSPSSTNDSELSDAESGSGEEDEEIVTPPTMNRDMEDDLLDLDDEEGGDDKKYCTCQSVSYGDMVACDNESCPYEWFHWSCVGLKSEPVGTWICPVCTKGMDTKGMKKA